LGITSSYSSYYKRKARRDYELTFSRRFYLLDSRVERAINAPLVFLAPFPPPILN
jgi:hypothetical protein